MNDKIRYLPGVTPLEKKVEKPRVPALGRCLRCNNQIFHLLLIPHLTLPNMIKIHGVRCVTCGVELDFSRFVREGEEPVEPTTTGGGSDE